MIPRVKLEDLAKYVPTYVDFQELIEGRVQLSGENIPFSFPHCESVGGYISLLEGGKFTIMPFEGIYRGIPTDLLLENSLITDEQVATIEAEQVAVAEKASRVAMLDRGCARANADLDKARNLAFEVGEDVMAEAITRLVERLDETKRAYKLETGKDWYEDIGF